MPSTRAPYISAFPSSWNSSIKGEITRAIASDLFYPAPRGRNRTPLSSASPSSSSSCSSTYRGLTSRRDTPSTLSHMGLTVLVMDNKATRTTSPSPASLSRAFAASVQYFTAYLLFGDARLRSTRRDTPASRRQWKFLKFFFSPVFCGTRFTRTPCDIFDSTAWRFI